MQVMDEKAHLLFKRIINFLTHYSLFITILTVLVGFSLSFYYLTSASDSITNENSKLEAQRYLETLTAFRTLYTSEVVNTAKNNGLRITHDYKNYDDAIPLPATLSMALGKAIGNKRSDAKTYLYSGYPFPWRTQENEKLFSQSFSRDAWQSLTENPDKPFFRFENLEGQMSIRYAIADVMRPGCIDCHNNHLQTPKNDWIVGDVRGVMEVILPINLGQAQSTSSFQAAFVVLISMTLVVALVIFLFFMRLKKDTLVLQATNDNLQQKQNEIKVVNDEIMLAHDELKQQTIELQHSNNAKSDFLATMSHEIRTPINGVVGMLSLLKQTDLDREQQQKVKLAHFSADSLLSIINDILDFSKIEANKLEVEAIDYDLCELLGNFTNSIAHRAQEKNINVILDLTQIETTFVKGDPGRLTQILTNLVGNAIKFTEQGEIKIRANLDRIDEQNLQLSCSVSDTGIGVPKDRIATMFDRFIQVDASTTRKFGGTGLGLAIVKKLCQIMDGDISVTSELDKGSTFKFSIRLQHSDQQEKSAPVVNLNSLNLMVVDDNKTNVTVLSDQLTRWGAKVLQTTDSQSTLHLMLQQFDENEKNHFDIILIDAKIPAIGGVELAQKIRSHQQFSATKLILMKPLNTSNDNKYYDDLGFDCCLTKPVTKSDLADVLNAVISNDEVSKLMLSANTEPNAQHLKQQTLADGMRILLVDDNAINQAVASCQLRNLGGEVTVAKNGLEALQCLQEQVFDVVLMDCQMPVMDGYTATQKIRELSEEYSNIYIIAMTANAMKGDREKCLNAGMNDYLTKPIDFALMETKLITASNRLLNADIISTGSI